MPFLDEGKSRGFDPGAFSCTGDPGDAISQGIHCVVGGKLKQGFGQGPVGSESTFHQADGLGKCRSIPRDDALQELLCIGTGLAPRLADSIQRPLACLIFMIVGHTEAKLAVVWYRMPRQCFILCLLPFWSGAIDLAAPLWGQDTAVVGTPDTAQVALRGEVLGPDGRGLPGCMIVNRNTGEGRFGSASGRFAFSVHPGDTIQFASIGYRTVSRSVPLEASSPQGWSWSVHLARMRVDVGTAEVIAPRDLGEIVRDIEALGYDEKEYRTSGIDALTSPITFLYEQFNRMERSKREVARLENEDRRRALLRELLGKYVDYQIVKLDEGEFDAFVAFMDPGEAVLKALTQYEFILWTKERFTAFRARPEQLEDSDFEYQWDD